MNKATLIQQVNAFLRDGETGEAINALLDFLDQHHRQQPELYEEVIQLKAIFKRAKRQVAMNIISEAHAAQELEELNDTIEDILRKINRVFKGKPSKKTTPSLDFSYGIGGVGLGLCALLVFIFWGMSDKEKPDYCPDFNVPSSWHTLIVPFQYSTNKKTVLQSTLDSIAQSVGFDATCKTANIDFNNAAYPNTLQKAKAIGQGCRTDLVFWKNISEDRKKMRYHFVQLGDYFQFNLLSPTQNDVLDTIAIETSIPAINEIAEQEDTPAVYTLLMGIGANKAQRHPIALRLLNSIPETTTLSTDLNLLKWMHLADSYRMLNDKDAAIAAYSSILNQYDSYTLASINRGVLYWSLGNYAAAIEDFNTVLSADSSYVFAFGGRAHTCLEINMVDEAEAALLKGEYLVNADSSPSLKAYKKDVINPLLVETRKRKSALREAIRLGKDALRQNSKNIKLSNELARAYLQVGDIHHAIGLLYKFGPGDLEVATRKTIQHRITAMQDENFLVDLETFLLD
ncbi:MAG: tetratricopeptide repeat protein [Bacteroidota bacterium]